MTVTLHSTDKIVDLVLENKMIAPARVWEGVTSNGVACHAYITRIAVRDGLDASEFARDLQEHRRPTPEVGAIPLRLII